MDTFMDKLAQKLTAQEMINANTAAETEEMNRLREEVAEYKECLEKLQQLLESGADRLESGAARFEAGAGKLENAQIDNSGIERLVEESLYKIREAQVDNSSIERLVEESISRLEQSGNEIERISDVTMAKLSQIRQSDEMLDQIRAIESKVAALTTLQDENLADLGSILEKKIMQVPYMVEERMAQTPDGLSTTLDAKFEERAASTKEMIDAKALEMSEGFHRECVKVYRNVQAVVVEENAKQQEQVEDTMSRQRDSLKKVFYVSAAAAVISGLSLVFQVLSYLHVF
ncbi:MAG: hypothetical protein IJ833_05585 [Lachnospiraceae bacterium]|nr:hypothetical protein [Lachnospiraceae bacterium]